MFTEGADQGKSSKAPFVLGIYMTVKLENLQFDCYKFCCHLAVS